MAFNDKSAIWQVDEESSYGVYSGSWGASTAVQFISPSMDGEIEKIDREVIRNTLVKEKSILGKETCTGTLPVEVTAATGTGASATVNGDKLYKNAIGKKLSATVSEVPTASTVSTVTVADASVYTIGQALKLVRGTSSKVVIVTAIDTGTDVVTFAPNTAFVTVDSVVGLLTYVINRPEDSVSSLAIREFITDGVSDIAYTYNGVMVNSLSMEFPLASIIKTTFNVGGAGFSSATGVTAPTTSCTDLDPEIAKNMTFTYDGTSYDIKTLDVSIENAIYDNEALTTSGISNKTVTAKSTIGGSFSLEYTGTTLFSKVKANTTGQLYASATSTQGKRFGVFAPAVVLNMSSKSVENGIYQESVDYQCVNTPNACTNGVDDAISIWFEN